MLEGFRGSPDAEGRTPLIHTEKLILNLVKLKQSLIEITLFRLVCTRYNSVWCLIDRKILIAIQNWFDLTRFRKCFLYNFQTRCSLRHFLILFIRFICHRNWFRLIWHRNWFRFIWHRNWFRLVPNRNLFSLGIISICVQNYRIIWYETNMQLDLFIATIQSIGIAQIEQFHQLIDIGSNNNQ